MLFGQNNIKYIFIFLLSGFSFCIGCETEKTILTKAKVEVYENKPMSLNREKLDLLCVIKAGEKLDIVSEYYNKDSLIYKVSLKHTSLCSGIGFIYFDSKSISIEYPN